MGKSAGKICAYLIVVAIMIIALFPCATAEESPVKVGYFDCGDYFNVQKDEGVLSYDAAFLKLVAEYSGMSFEYVDCGTWANALAMLENREIDLLGTMQRSKEREEQFAICQSSYGVTAAELVALPVSDIGYQDYTAINKATIGVLTDYVRMPELNELLEKHSLTPTIKYYDTQEALFSALGSESVDVIAANSHTLPAEWNVVEKFAYSKYYFATWQGNESLVREIDDALIRIQLYRPDFRAQTQTRFFPGLMLEPYSVSELDFIAKQPALDVYLNDGSEPLAYRDADGNLTGILVELCEMIERETGLTFNYRALAGKEANAPGATSIVINVPDTGVSEQASVSDTFFITNFLLYCRAGNPSDMDADGAYSVVLPQHRQSFIDYLEEKYPNCLISQMDTPEECIRAVSTGKADLTMLSSYLVDNICKRRDIDNIVAIPSLGVPMSFSMILEGPDAVALTGIINKGISRMDRQEISAVQVSYALRTMPDNTFGYFVKNNAAIVIVVVVLLMLVAGVLIYARMLARKNAAIRKANKAKSEFMSTMSHDIRTPMNAIINIAKLAQDDYTGGGGENVLNDLKQISSVSDFLMCLLNDVLDMASIESGKLPLHPGVYHYEEFLAYLGSVFDTLCKQKNIRFVHDKSGANLALWVDKVRFNQVFFNLLSNAVKFTPEGGTVTYRVADNVVKDGFLSCTFEVSDTGCGMSEEFQRRMFEPFEQENGAQNAYHGTGLGLSIANNIVVRMGGEIVVKSVPGQGTSFFVRLMIPIATKEQIAAAEKREEPVASLDGRHILVVEDNVTNVIVLTRFLAKKGVVCMVTHDGAEGVDAFLNSEPGSFDMILMDLRMPVMGGIEATKLIRAAKRPDAATIPILAMTADAFDNDVEATKAAGMNAHLTKPVVAETLYRVIGQYLADK